MTESEMLTEIYNICKERLSDENGDSYLYETLFKIMELIDPTAYKRWFYDTK